MGWVSWKFDQYLLTRVKEIEEERILIDTNQELLEEVRNFKKIRKAKDKFDLLRFIIGVLESAFFIFIAIIFLNKEGLGAGFFLIIAKAAGAWIALKIFGNYSQWKGMIMGRAHFYIFLIGSLLNILFSVIVGGLIFSFVIR